MPPLPAAPPLLAADDRRACADAGTPRPVPLRPGQAGTDAVVEAHPIRCPHSHSHSHEDDYRSSTPAAVYRSRLHPARQSPPAPEQPGCLNAGTGLSIGSACD